MAYNVKVVNKTTKSAEGPNGPYTYISLEVDYNGEVSEKKIFPAALKKYPNLKSELDRVKAGDTVGLETTQNGKYKEISKLVIGEQQFIPMFPIIPPHKSTGYKSTYTKKDDDYSLGQQVGNALTNAAATLGGKATIAQLEQRAYEIILLGNRLKEKIKSGQTAKDNEEPPEMSDTNHMGTTDDEEDVPF